ncbi:MAG: hypothetical protein ACPG7F_02455 [Aggregatilineales bacterium]
MHKPERNWFIRAAGNFDMALTDERRAQLAQKGQRLYAKYCGLNGDGICAESFAEYHALRGETIVVKDFLDFLRTAYNEEIQPEHRQMTATLIKRVEALIE